MVDDASAVVINEVVEDSKIKITIAVAEKEVGKVIGKEGRTIKALRTIASCMHPRGQAITIDILK